MTMGNWTERVSLRKIAAALIAVCAIVHLIAQPVHTSALLLLEDEICGFLMFMFVLMGLVTLFEATRVKDGDRLSKCIGAAFCAITDFFGYKLTEIYLYALRNQRGLDAGPVWNAFWLSVGVMAVFALAAVLLLVDAALDGRRRRRHGG